MHPSFINSLYEETEPDPLDYERLNVTGSGKYWTEIYEPMLIPTKVAGGLRWFGIALHHPRLTFNRMLTSPYLTRGVRFGCLAKFTDSRQSKEACTNEPNPLATYFQSHTEGPGIWKWMHYFDVYQRHLSKFVGREVHVLEIGIYSGGSLPMWREYFGERSHIYGVDIEDACRIYEGERIKVFIGDQADRSFWAEFRKSVPTIDVLIDDGGHLAEQQIVTLEEMLPHMGPGGVYLCEDITSIDNRFAAYIQGLSNNLNFASWCSLENEAPGIASATSPFQSSINSIHLYPFVTVIEKSEVPLARLVSPKQGTQWQPFL